MLTIPEKLEEAAKLDGAGHPRSSPEDPAARPASPRGRCRVLLHLLEHFLWPLVVINSETMKVLTVGIATLACSIRDRLGRLMPRSVLTVLPVVIVFLAQRQIVEDIAATGLKG